MRRLPILFLAALVLCVAAGLPAHAADEPDFTLEDVAPARGARPAGWSPVVKSGVVPATAPSAGMLLDVARKAQVDLATFDARSRPMQKGDGTAGVCALVSVNGDSKKFTAALADAAVAHGWQVREIGSPNRVAVVWSSSKAAGSELLTWQTRIAVGRLCDIVGDRLAEVRDREGFQRVVALLQTAGNLEPEASAVHAIRGRIMELMRNPDEALVSYRKALDVKAPVQAGPKWTVSVAYRLGQMLLTQEDDDVVEEALAALKRAVALEKHAENDMMRFGNRYNLACAYARLDRIDEALDELERSLKIGKEKLSETYEQQYEHAKERDPDMEPLREHPRFAQIMEKYAP